MREQRWVAPWAHVGAPFQGSKNLNLGAPQTQAFGLSFKNDPFRVESSMLIDAVPEFG